MREILTEHTMASGGGRLSVMYFEETASPESQQAALQTFWFDVYQFCHSGASFKVAEEGREISPTTGELLAFWAGDTTVSTPGDSGTTPVPDASQGLIQWRTSTIAGGRLVQGRTFVPSLGGNNMLNGNVIAAARSGIATAAGGLIAGGAGLGIWKRPSDTAVGSLEPVTSATCWEEFAVLRRRRG